MVVLVVAAERSLDASVHSTEIQAVATSSVGLVEGVARSQQTEPAQVQRVR